MIPAALPVINTGAAIPEPNGEDTPQIPHGAAFLQQAALGFARLCDPADLPAGRATACRKISELGRRADVVLTAGHCTESPFPEYTNEYGFFFSFSN